MSKQIINFGAASIRGGFWCVGGYRTQYGGSPHEACLKSILLKEKHVFLKSGPFGNMFGFSW